LGHELSFYQDCGGYILLHSGWGKTVYRGVVLIVVYISGNHLPKLLGMLPYWCWG
jgi:hypothetical protein